MQRASNYLEDQRIKDLIIHLRQPILGYATEILAVRRVIDQTLEQFPSQLMIKKLIWSTLDKGQKIFDFLCNLTSEEIEWLADPKAQEAIDKIGLAVFLECPDNARTTATEINDLISQFPNPVQAKKLIWNSCHERTRESFAQLLKAEPPPPIEVGSKVICSWHPDWGVLEVARIEPWEHDPNKLLYWVTIPDGRETFYFKQYLEGV